LPEAAAAAAARLEAALAGPASRIEMVKSVFFRGKGAYLIGCAFPVQKGPSLAFGLALLHGETGISVDAVLTGEDDIAILFSFTRSYFRVEAESPHELARILKALMPRKRLGELYTAIGYHNSTAKPNSTATSCATWNSPRTGSKPPRAHAAWS